MNFLQKVEKMESEQAFSPHQAVDSTYMSVNADLKELNEKVENMLLQAYYSKIDENRYLQLHEELMEDLYSLSRRLNELDKCLKTNKKNVYSLECEYRKIYHILEDSYGSIQNGQKVCAKIIEQEKQKGNKLLKRISATIMEWTTIKLSDIANLKSTEIEENVGLLGEVNYQNEKVDVLNQAGRIYYDLNAMQQEIVEYIEEGYFKENMDNVISHIQDTLEEIKEVIYTLPLHASYTEEYFRNDIENILFELENQNCSYKTAWLTSFDKKELMNQYADRMILKFALAQAQFVSEQNPKSLESLKDEIALQLNARLHGAYEVICDLETNPIRNLLSPAQFSDLITTWRFIKSSSLRALDCLKDCKPYIKYLPHQDNDQDVFFDGKSEKRYTSF